MYESPDNPASKPDIDGLFQKLAQDYEPPFDPAAWHQMLQRLEQSRPYAQARQLLLLIALLFVGGSQLYSGGGHKTGQPTAAIALADQPCQPDISGSLAQPEIVAKTTGSLGQPDVDPTSGAGKPETITSISAVHVDHPTVGPTANQPAKPARQSATWPQSPAGQPATNQTSVTLSRQARQRRSTGLHSGSQRDRQLAMQQRPNPADALTNPGLSNAGSVPTLPPTRARNPETTDAMPPAERTNVPTQPESRSMVAVIASVVDLPKSTDSLASVRPVALPASTVLAKPDSTAVVAPVVQTDTVAQTDSKPVTSKPIRQNGLSFMVLVSPDLTTVGLTNFAQPGTNYGLMAEYRFARRWSVQTGVIRSTKIYNALSSQYKYPSTWKLDVPFESVAGRCQMLDLPLNVRFDVLTGKRPVTSNGAVPRLFVSAGVTTYIMLSEVYDYIYENPSDPRIVFWKWQGKTGRYNFSQANVSMGYERPIGGKWSVQAEPFIKIPIEQVGFFKIRLISTGVFLGLRYKL